MTALRARGNQSLRTRIAPTPSGYLHIGNAFSFILTWLLARQNGGNLLLRIDDLDRARKRPEYVQDIFESLEWLGIDWDSGPTGPDDFESKYSQIHRLDLYADAFDRLRLTDRLFACSCTRREVEARSHRCACEISGLPLDSPNCSVRFRLEESCEVTINDLDPVTVRVGETHRNFVIRKRDGMPAYQLTSIVDDIHFKTTLIVRGLDLLESSGLQLKIQDALGDRSPLQFLHHPLVTKVDGSKLSKSKNDTSLRSVRENSNAAMVIKEFSHWINLPGKSCESLSDLLEQIRGIA
ncbi:MAG: tRNA glutamyl-Q synthetase [Spirochaetia bacterium]|nr:tRNA glutamyl-Q synthetase [Spirochaetia bacterium]